jgi:hypothetical protein
VDATVAPVTASAVLNFELGLKNPGSDPTMFAGSLTCPVATEPVSVALQMGVETVAMAVACGAGETLPLLPASLAPSPCMLVLRLTSAVALTEPVQLTGLRFTLVPALGGV